MKNLIPVLLVATVFLAGCKDDDPDDPIIPNEEELITTLRYELVPVNGGDTLLLEFRDLDGDGGAAPVISTDPLAKNTTYNGFLTLLNEIETPAENITDEVKEEDEEHQFFYQLSNPDYQVSYRDTDANNNPVGIESTLVTDSTNSTLTITLRHEPNKSAAGVSSGDITNAGGETDIEVTFNLNVK